MRVDRVITMWPSHGIRQHMIGYMIEEPTGITVNVRTQPVYTSCRDAHIKAFDYMIASNEHLP